MHTLVDTHAHLYLDQFNEDRDEIIQLAQLQGVKKILLPNIDKSTVEGMLAMEEKYRGTCFAMMGLHPCSVTKDYKTQLNDVEQWLDKREFIAVGEIGTDMHWDKTLKSEQEGCFRAQIRMAKERSLPIVIHSRETLDWNIEIIEEEQDGSLRGIFHCFNGTIDQGKMIKDLGFFMGLGGVVTFKNSGMSEVIPHLDPNFCVLETDAPYLTPVPYRGKRNESSYVKIIAETVAGYWERSIDDVAQITSNNAVKIFGESIIAS